MSDESKQAENPFDGVRVVNGTLVIPSDRYIVRKVTIEYVDQLRDEYGETHVPCDVQYEVNQRPGWSPRTFTMVSSG
jgi:hypothetical protein